MSPWNLENRMYIKFVTKLAENYIVLIIKEIKPFYIIQIPLRKTLHIRKFSL